MTTSSRHNPFGLLHGLLHETIIYHNSNFAFTTDFRVYKTGDNDDKSFGYGVAKKHEINGYHRRI
jgi:hypothetical protein